MHKRTFMRGGGSCTMHKWTIMGRRSCKWTIRGGGAIAQSGHETESHKAAGARTSKDHPVKVSSYHFLPKTQIRLLIVLFEKEPNSWLKQAEDKKQPKCGHILPEGAFLGHSFWLKSKDTEIPQTNISWSKHKERLVEEHRYWRDICFLFL